MAKVKASLMSLKAHGTIGNQLTYQDRGRNTIVRRKPTPADRRTLPQTYQRWLYQDYITWWHTLSAGQKQQWESDARPYRLTGFAYWMKTRLTDLPDIVGGWHLDSIASGSVIDFSRNNTSGAVNGATLVDGYINKCLSFDGVNNYVDFGMPAIFDMPGNITIAFWLKNPPGLDPGNIIGNRWHQVAGWTVLLHTNGRLRYQTSQLGTNQLTQSNLFGIYADLWQPIIITREGVTAKIYWFNTDITDVSGNHLDPAPAINNLRMGGSHAHGNYITALIDEPRIYNRILSSEDRQKYCDRKYPE